MVNRAKGRGRLQPTGSGGSGGRSSAIRTHPRTDGTSSDGAVSNGAGPSVRTTMGIRAERSMETRDRVLAVALEQLEAGGEAAVRIDEIRDRSGVSIGSIYHHFGDREGVIAAAQLRRFARFAEFEVKTLADVVERSADVEEFRAHVRRLTLESRSEVRTERRWGRIGVLASTIGRGDLRADIEQIQTRFADGFAALVVQAQSRGFFRSDLDARAIVAFVEAYSIGAVLNDVDARGVADPEWEKVVWVVIDSLIPAA
jgi:AcrR family transcriptional regulator